MGAAEDRARCSEQLVSPATGAGARDATPEGAPPLADVLARLGHDLNQPLSAIVTYARGALLRSRAGTLGPGDLEQILSIIVMQALRVADHVRMIGTQAEKEQAHADRTHRR